MGRYIDLLAILATGALLYTIHKRRKPSLPLPPGLKGLPLVGNLFQVPSELQWMKYHEWASELNTDILHLQAAGTHIIILDKYEVAADLLDSRSSLYSGRPRMVMLTELMGQDFNLGLMDYGGAWRKHRRLVHQSLQATAIKRYRPHLVQAMRKLLKRLLDDRDDGNLMPHFRQLTAETILSVAYGMQIQQENDPYVKLSEDANRGAIIAAVPGRFLVEFIPILKYVPAWFPGASFKQKAQEWYKMTRAMVEVPYADAKRRLESGNPAVSILRTNLQKIEAGGKDDAFTEDVLRNTLAVLYAGATDTTVSTMASCVLGLMEHPEVLKKAQVQIDGVVKPGHFPDFDDEPSLPYITAIVKEALRWRDITPTGVPHALSTEDEYKGYRLPAGAIIIANQWAMLHDEDVYADPFEFNPDRFINPETGKIDYSRARDPGRACFGFGRRICPGRFIAYETLWLTIASFIATFDIKKPREKVTLPSGEEVERTVELTHEYEPGLIV
ncbi:hypothetical protein EST38_g3849 [Candolleomyces aberdarensis]|uniref:Cytochrome P450 n=1 Tax=Candolleomyces aberdarensis TaxID=2316362 RepID=A0A4Q2DSI9_9AGAR|nr:hypothetical protein EST38_g3849 [Candolleomyces aberdarensis]